jgi:hypothetical protein
MFLPLFLCELPGHRSFLAPAKQMSKVPCRSADVGTLGQVERSEIPRIGDHTGRFGYGQRAIERMTDLHQHIQRNTPLQSAQGHAPFSV